ncbi:alpha/beta hydrolase [Rhabdothermincola sediminis]|uniref:alpha/beta hydrolase n=1 Tax=Rhabdothermincola sediminis TaxID=2751370 RepID=UPI001AA09177|nr:dienelactone hydrolase family protein [Rhabdothermincola sediminis]
MPRTGGPSAPAILVGLHGYDDHPSRLERVLASLPGATGIPRLVPSGPVRTPGGYGWFGPDPDGPTDASPPLSCTLDRLEAQVVDACAAAQVDPAGAVVVGYSQGAATALALALRRGARWRPAAVGAVAAWLPHDPSVEWALADAAGHTEVLLVHGEQDEVVPVVQGRSARRALERHGLEVTWVEHAGGHDLEAPPAVEALDRWLGRLRAGR